MVFMKIKRETKADREERRKGVLMEDLDGKLDLVLEGQLAIGKQLADFKSEVNGRFRDVDFKFETVFGELRDIRRQVNAERI